MEKWSRKKIKEIAKIRMKANYWKSVLVGAVIMLLAGTGGMSVVSSSVDSYTDNLESSIETTQDVDDTMVETTEDDWRGEYKKNTIGIIAVITIVTFIVILGGIILLLNVFVFNPLLVGCNRFFYRNLDKNAEVKEICYTFDRGYKNAVKTMFFSDLYIFLWSLLFIIPGIIKSYEYELIPYLLSENENMTKAEAFAESKRLMKGNKWRAFVLEISLIPWMLLSGLTFGIAGWFYVFPYFSSIGAAFYQAIKEEDLFRIAEEVE